MVAGRPTPIISLAERKAGVKTIAANISFVDFFMTVSFNSRSQVANSTVSNSFASTSWSSNESYSGMRFAVVPWFKLNRVPPLVPFGTLHIDAFQTGGILWRGRIPISSPDPMRSISLINSN